VIVNDDCGHRDCHEAIVQFSKRQKVRYANYTHTKSKPRSEPTMQTLGLADSAERLLHLIGRPSKSSSSNMQEMLGMLAQLVKVRGLRTPCFVPSSTIAIGGLGFDGHCSLDPTPSRWQPTPGAVESTAPLRPANQILVYLLWFCTLRGQSSMAVNVCKLPFEGAYGDSASLIVGSG
jgi:hypothetical protein